MSDLPVKTKHFKVDTSRPHSRSKMRSKVRHIMAVASGMFPLMGVFIVVMAWFRLPPERAPYYKMAIIFVGCGMVALLWYAWLRAENIRRREIAQENRDRRRQNREDAHQREAAERQAQKGNAMAKEG